MINSLTLSSSVRFIKGVGPRKESLLALLGIQQVSDLLFVTPRSWEDRRISNERLGAQPQHHAFLVKISKVKEQANPRSRFSIFQAHGECDHPQVRHLLLLWIRRRSRFDVFGKMRLEIRPGAWVLVWGKIEPPAPGSSSDPQMTVDEYEPLTQGRLPADLPQWNRLVPVYASTAGLTQRELRQWRVEALRLWRQTRVWQWPDHVEALLPKGVREISWAYQKIHFPDSFNERTEARLTLAFWEIFLLALAMEQRRRVLMGVKKPRLSVDHVKGKELFERMLKSLGFLLTQSQKNAIEDILSDMKKDNPMNRLLQGEVGSGKTLVALAAICHVVGAGRQCAFIAPTEILVFQHAVNFRRLLEPLGIKVASLTGDTSVKDRMRILEDLKSGSVSVVVGTHSLLDPEVQFNELALIVIDEQHRFGVSQRSVFRSKTATPDCLVLSATPIPRTLALALYGDLDVTTMEELPAGRSLAKVHLATVEHEAWNLFKERLDLGQQAFVVVPAIEDQEQFDNLERVLAKLKEMFPQFQSISVHGRMTGREKEEALSAFERGEAQILAATTVIEVGIDISSAGVMMVLSAERFGLATLHQLRGRVGRGRYEGLCILLPSFELSDSGTASSRDALFAQEQSKYQEAASEGFERLRRFCECQNGFEVGLLDLEWRGPGDLLGHEQHGNYLIRHFNWSEDQQLIAPARQGAQMILSEDPLMNSQSALRQAVQMRYGTSYAVNELS